MQVRSLGAAGTPSPNPDEQGQGRPLVDEVGELVCTRPMPSMPLYFWGDKDNERYLSSYFDMYPGPNGEGIWRHGDWLRITPTGGGIIYGPSDATINRHGIRMGTAELYRAVETHPEVLDSLVVDLEYLGRPSCLLLFVHLRDGVAMDDALQRRLRESIKKALSARHVPDEIHGVGPPPAHALGQEDGAADQEAAARRRRRAADPRRDAWEAAGPPCSPRTRDASSAFPGARQPPVSSPRRCGRMPGVDASGEQSAARGFRAHGGRHRQAATPTPTLGSDGTRRSRRD
ncbi:acetoacetyl-CoA synthetase [Ditylenchus destructor]|nr:acetoacetyl-CoA synthetase [Ditylenchus destructor]